LGVGHPKRIRSLPDVPAITEILPGFNNTSWYGLFAPAGTPSAIVNKLNAEMKAAVANPEFVKQVETIGLEPASSTPKELHDMVRTELARWTKIIRDHGIQSN
jgi:tripartite-type tricarboxylate transporter receptor subunit TctC